MWCEEFSFGGGGSDPKDAVRGTNLLGVVIDSAGSHQGKGGRVRQDHPRSGRDRGRGGGRKARRGGHDGTTGVLAKDSCVSVRRRQVECSVLPSVPAEVSLWQRMVAGGCLMALEEIVGR